MRSTILLSILFFTGTLIAQDYWKQLKGPEGGEVGRLYSTPAGLYLISRSGFHRSIDDGLSWKRIPSSLPDNDSRGYLGHNSKGDIFFASFSNGLYKSSDMGENWSLVHKKDSFTDQPNGIFIDKQDRIYIFLSNAIVSVSTNDGEEFVSLINRYLIGGSKNGFFADGDSLMYVHAHDKIYSSNDNGKTWKSYKFSTWIRYFGVNSALVPFVLFDNNTLLFSKNQGINWDTLTLPVFSGYLTNILFGKDSILYVNTEEKKIFVTADYGKSWNSIPTAGLVEDGRLFKDLNFGLYSSTTSNGLFKFDETHKNWVDINKGLYCQRIEGIEISKSGEIFTLAPNGLFRSENGGNAWNLLMRNSNYHSKQQLHIVKLNNNLYYSNSNGLYKSVDSGNTWDSIKVCETCKSVAAISSDNSGILYAGSQGKLYRSIDNGDNWNAIDSYKGFGMVQIFINDKGWIYVAGSQLYLSKDDGLTWKNLNAPVGFEISINRIYADTSGNTFLIMSNLPLLRSEDEGLTWTWLDVSIWGGSVDFKILNNGDYMLSAHDGVYISKDKGDTWNLNISGLIDWTSTYFNIDKEGYIYLGTYSTSIYKSTQRITRLTVDGYFENSIDVNYYNDHIHLTTESKHNQDYSISIINLDGKQIKTFSNQHLQSGKNEIEFPLHGLTPGIYFFQMNTGNQFYSGKFVVTE